MHLPKIAALDLRFGFTSAKIEVAKPLHRRVLERLAKLLHLVM